MLVREASRYHRHISPPRGLLQVDVPAECQNSGHLEYLTSLLSALPHIQRIEEFRHHAHLCQTFMAGDVISPG